MGPVLVFLAAGGEVRRSLPGERSGDMHQRPFIWLNLQLTSEAASMSCSMLRTEVCTVEQTRLVGSKT